MFFAPTALQPTPARSFEPDLLVVRRDAPGEAAISVPLALAVEVVSPSSRSVDLVLKRALYEQAGVAHYWVLDPDEATLTAWSLTDGAYGPPVVVVDGDVPGPFPLRVVVGDLLR